MINGPAAFSPDHYQWSFARLIGQPLSIARGANKVRPALIISVAIELII